MDTARIAPDDKVLIHAGSGGVGHLAVQLAVHLGAEVTAVTSRRGLELVQSLGAAHVVDRSDPGWPETVSAQDVVVDTVGGSISRFSLRLIGADGMVVALHPYAHDELARSDRRLRRMLVEPDHHALSSILALHRSGRLVPHIGARYELERTGEALRHVEQARTTGKVIIHL
ncbi:zinc-binding dehydrogenase [Arthrobacter sp. RAF14]|uniref:zinc-binding dehydrogenase n=1 Tax=Arthrobacter sp. RAF14 TaxID=3233051 RepID=UPI003F90DDD7